MFQARGLRSCSTATGYLARHTSLFLRRELEDVPHKQLPMIFVVSLERWRCRPGEHIVIAFFAEQARRHRRAGTDALRIGDPALGPAEFQTLFGHQEVGRGGRLVVIGIACSMTL